MQYYESFVYLSGTESIHLRLVLFFLPSAQTENCNLSVCLTGELRTACDTVMRN